MFSRTPPHPSPSAPDKSAPPATPSPQAVDFVRFCYRRRRVGWPDLYDEMCAVAGRHLYRGWGSDDLSEQGIGLSLFEMPALAALTRRVVAEEQHRAPPAAVVDGERADDDSGEERSTAQPIAAAVAAGA